MKEQGVKVPSSGGAAWFVTDSDWTVTSGESSMDLMERNPNEATVYDYRVLATNKTPTVQKEIQEAGDADYEAVGEPEGVA